MGMPQPRLRQGVHEYVLLGFHEPVPDGHELVVFGERWLAERRVREFAQDDFNLRTLRALVSTHTSTQSYGPLSDELVLRKAAELLSSRLLSLARVPPRRGSGVLAPREKPEVRPAPVPVEEKLRLMLQVVDDVTEDPIADLALSIKLPDGSTKKATTDAEGRISLSDVPRGRVDITSVLDGATLAETLAFVKLGALASLQREAKSRRRRRAAEGRFLARVIEHKVTDGETLESIAAAHDLSVDALTRFNWGTTDPDEIQQHLLIDVGCTAQDDSGKAVFTLHDDPGILYIARPLEMNWVALEERHILRVKKVREPRLYLFSA